MRNRILFYLGVLVITLVLTALVSQASSTPSDVKVQHIGPRAVAISCKDGADPTFNKVLSDELGTTVISCGKASR